MEGEATADAIGVLLATSAMSDDMLMLRCKGWKMRHEDCSEVEKAGCVLDGVEKVCERKERR